MFRLPSPAVSLSVSDRGDLVAASDRATTLIARAGREPASVSPPDGGHVDAVAVSPSGRTTVITGSDDELVERRFTSLFTEDLTRTDHGGLSERADTVVTTDDHVLLLDGAHGEWERRSVADWSLLAGSRIGFGVSNHGHAVSADGGFLTYTNGSGTIPVWGADRPSDHDTPPRTARAPIAEPLAITLNADATRLAVAEDATIFVSRVREAGAVPEDPVRLTGADHVNTDGLRFLGTGGQKLVSAAGSRVVLWDLDQTDRIGRAAPVPVSAGCSGCGPPTLAVSPDGARLVAFDGAGVAGVAGPLDAVGRLPALTFSGRYGPAVWDRDGRRVTVLVVPPAGGTTAPVPAGLPDFVRAVSAGERSSEVLDAALSSDGAHVVAVQQDGGIDVVDLATGTVQAVTEPPTAPKPPDVAVAAAGPDLVAVVAGDAVVVREALTGQEVGRLAATDVGFLEFAPGRLLVQRTSGELEVWDDRLTERRQVIAGDPGFVRPPVANADGTLVARVRADGTVVLVDLETGTPVASLAAGPPGRRVGVGFSADGDHLVTVTEGDGLDLGSAVSRTLSAEAMVLAACRTAGRDLTPTEWRALVDAEPPDDLRCR
ncbi:WD40 repeat domain-containing protein [Umezawaea endophytica]|uniref:WD40 repeat domain-containing protein n=1 Tax=Umezawaea endophytica TaxID=1654476 RepID=A0A9X3AHG5_9PSEU|nr:WD40 repeat domain-containing protein [Umezawaea endophytica]